ncbi:MAG: peptidoglycan bridge formation glycyltransferase FemA/FemB family protein, partial [Patescibacteria group bacterium]
PIFASGSAIKRDIFDFFIAELKKTASRESGIIFLKVEMDREWGEIDPVVVGFRKSTKDIQARETMIMDLTQPEDDILREMKQKTRYNIKIAQKHSVKIIGVNAVKTDPQFFISMVHEMAVRNGFRPHSKKYFSDMMNLFLGKSITPELPEFAQKLYFAYYQEEVVAAALVGFFGGRATYLHGASATRHRNVMAPYLLHWEIMREVKKLGFNEYDFWGIVTQRTDKKQVKKWIGFSRFKEGFSGRVLEYPGAYDLVFNKLWYNGYKIARRMNI